MLPWNILVFDIPPFSKTIKTIMKEGKNKGKLNISSLFEKGNISSLFDLKYLYIL